MEASNAIYFITASMALTIAPGPDIIFVITQSISQGKKAGIATALGLCSGILVHTTAAALGISAILHQSAIAFQILKYAGAIYLLFLAWKALKEGEHLLPTGSVRQYNLLTLYKRGILMNILNPKVSLFFLAFLPQFVTPKAGDVAVQMILLGLLFMLQAVAIFTTIAIFSGSIGKKLLGKPKLAKYINLTKAAIFAFIGVNLAFTSR